MKKWMMIYGLAHTSLLLAHPKDPVIREGEASSQYVDAETLSITTADKSYIFWDGFSIAEGEVVQILQPSSESSVIIEVEGSQSEISGKLTSNGRLFFINPSGIFIGESGYIEADSLLLSTYPACTSALFSPTEDVLFQGHTRSSIISQGRLKALKKHLHLIGYQIENKGAIDAPLGMVAMAAGYASILKKPTQKLAILPSFSEVDNELTGIDNSGMISACRVHMEADGSGYSVAIRHAGLINGLSSLDHMPSQIRFSADKGNVGIFGAMSVENYDGTGGEIKISANHIAFFENSTIDASGEKGGGTILIGQDRETPSAKTVFVDKDVVISADALKAGDGGMIMIWADEANRFHGTASVCGGEEWGDGGFIDILTKHTLDFKGEIDVSAPQGEKGNFSLNTVD